MSVIDHHNPGTGSIYSVQELRDIVLDAFCPYEDNNFVITELAYTQSGVKFTLILDVGSISPKYRKVGDLRIENQNGNTYIEGIASF